MSDRTHQYRNLTRRDPATTAAVYGRSADATSKPIDEVAGALSVTQSYLDVYLMQSAAGVVVKAGLTGADGYIDVRRFKSLAICGMPVGTFVDEAGNSTVLGFDGKIGIEYKLHPLSTHDHVLATNVNLATTHTELIDPETPKDISGIGFIRIKIESNTGGGNAVFFVMAK